MAVAKHYQGLLSGFVFDQLDHHQEEAIHNLGVETMVTDTLMDSGADRRQLAEEVLRFGREIISDKITE